MVWNKEEGKISNINHTARKTSVPNGLISRRPQQVLLPKKPVSSTATLWTLCKFDHRSFPHRFLCSQAAATSVCPHSLYLTSCSNLGSTLAIILGLCGYTSAQCWPNSCHYPSLPCMSMARLYSHGVHDNS